MSQATLAQDDFISETRYGVTRRYGRGSRNIIAHASFGCGAFETVAASPGPFWSAFDVYAVVVSVNASFGPLSLNKFDVAVPDCPQRRHSLFCPGDIVSGSFSSDVIYDILYLDPHWVDDVVAMECDVRELRLPSIARLAPSPMLLALWRRIRCVVDGDSAPGGELAKICMRLLVLLLAEPQLHQVGGRTVHRRDRQLTRALDYIDANLDGDLNLARIADRERLSTFHFCRVFRRVMGVTVRKYVLEQRLERARKMLSASDRSICDIAHECGFSSQSHLTTAFRTRFGTTPNVFRRGGTARANFGAYRGALAKH